MANIYEPDVEYHHPTDDEIVTVTLTGRHLRLARMAVRDHVRRRQKSEAKRRAKFGEDFHPTSDGPPGSEILLDLLHQLGGHL